MAKLFFRYGTVASAKTLNLLAVAHNYKSQKKKILVLKPKLDSRFGETTIRSRAGLETEADYLVEDDTVFGDVSEIGEGEDASKIIDERELDGSFCILVDEAQFLSPSFVNQLHNITVMNNVPVICYGLRTDFRRDFFPGAARLMEIADEITEIKTVCAFCDKKAIFNLKFVNGKATQEGPTVDLGADEKYQPACKGCYAEQISGELARDVRNEFPAGDPIAIEEDGDVD